MNFSTNDMCSSVRQCVYAVAVIALVLFAPLATAQAAPSMPSSGGLAARYPAGAIKSVEAADKALAEVVEERSGIEVQFGRDERDCYTKFFATSCLEDARERRRRALALVRPVEVEANTFKRKERVIERDQNLEQRRTPDELNVLLPRPEPEDQDDHAPDAIPQAAVAPESGRASSSESPGRAKRHAVRLKRQQIEQASETQKRADNVEAYKKKAAESEARQREIAEKKAEKERQRVDKEATKP